jgi:acetylornithine deacetylase
MKGYIACGAGRQCRRSSLAAALPVHLAFSYDEEVGCPRRALDARRAGAARAQTARLHHRRTHRAEAGARAQGQAGHALPVHGAACHSAYAPQGVNAIEYAAKLIGRLGEIGARLADPARHDRRFDPPYSRCRPG